MLAALVALAIGTQAQEAPSPASVVSKAIGRYAEARTLAGTVVFTQSAMGKKVTTKTELQIEKPTKVYLLQTRDGLEAGKWLVTSDGKTFSFDRPEGSGFLPPRLEEPIEADGVKVTLGDLYVAIAGSMGDRSPVINMLFGHAASLRQDRTKWMSLVYQGKVETKKGVAHQVAGALRQNVGQPPAGTFEFVITDAGDVVRYVEKQTFGTPGGKDAVEVVSVWDVDIAVDKPVDPAKFTVVHAP